MQFVLYMKIILRTPLPHFYFSQYEPPVKGTKWWAIGIFIRLILYKIKKTTVFIGQIFILK